MCEIVYRHAHGLCVCVCMCVHARAQIGVARNATGVAAMRFRSSTRSVPCVLCRDGSGMVGSPGWWW